MLADCEFPSVRYGKAWIRHDYTAWQSVWKRDTGHSRAGGNPACGSGGGKDSAVLSLYLTPVRSVLIAVRLPRGVPLYPGEPGTFFVLKIILCGTDPWGQALPAELGLRPLFLAFVVKRAGRLVHPLGPLPDLSRPATGPHPACNRTSSGLRPHLLRRSTTPDSAFICPSFVLRSIVHSLNSPAPRRSASRCTPAPTPAPRIPRRSQPERLRTRHHEIAERPPVPLLVDPMSPKRRSRRA